MIFFGMIYIDAWLNVQKQIHDYHIEQLYDESQGLEDQLIALTSRLAQLNNIGRLTSEAERLGLIDPDMHQYHTVVNREIKKRIPVSQTGKFEMAKTAPKTTTLVLSKGTAPQPLEPIPAPDGGNIPELVKNVEEETTPVAMMETYEMPVPADAGTSLIAPEQAAAPLEEDPDLALLTIEDMMTSL